MKKNKLGKKLSRSRTARDALMRSMVRALVEHGKITTTLAKAKFVQRNFDKLMSIAKKGDLAARRRLFSVLANDKKTAIRLFESAKKSKRNSGFLKFVPLPPRKGDASKMARLEVLEKLPSEKKKSKRSKKESKKKEKK